MNVNHMTRGRGSVVIVAVVAILAIIAATLSLAPIARADAGEGHGMKLGGEWHGSYDLGDGTQVWCGDYGKAEPMAEPATKYSEPEKVDVPEDELNVMVYALQEGKRAIENNDSKLAAAVSAVIHSSKVNEGLPFPDEKVPAEIRDDYNRIKNDAPPVPEGTYLTMRTPEDWKAGGTKEGHQRVFDFDQLQVGVIEVQKIDATNKSLLEGAEFKIQDESGNAVIDSRITKADGVYRVQVDPGKYTVTEGKAPNGYLLNGDGSPEANTQSLEVTPNDVIRVVFANLPYPTLKIVKKDESGKPLPGAVVHLTSDNNSVDAKFVTKDKPILMRVYPGKYTLRELKAPEGYVLNGEAQKTTVTGMKHGVLELTNVKEKPKPKPSSPPPSTTTVAPPPPAPVSIGTSAWLSSGNFIEKGAEVVDTVKFKGLTPGEEYTMNSSLVCKEDGAPTGNKATSKFTPESADGEVKVTIKVENDSCPIQVAYEELVKDGDIIAEHKDKGDEAQTVGAIKPQPKKERVIIKEIPSGGPRLDDGRR